MTYGVNCLALGRGRVAGWLCLLSWPECWLGQLSWLGS